MRRTASRPPNRWERGGLTGQVTQAAESV